MHTETMIQKQVYNFHKYQYHRQYFYEYQLSRYSRQIFFKDQNSKSLVY